ncbi:hypothetical protein H6F43_18870, partial [Leptolyngbya sp. FACHB-36]|uniref:hypothetical protein n=1 Tax=Leptolyngbya sp. FACHB-36 TaxID=2692808 RepID=UPI001680FCA8
VTCKGTADESFSEESVTVAEAPAAKISYPWNPADLEADEFFAQVEQSSIFDAMEAEEISARSQAFFAQIDGLWATPTVSLREVLAQRFSARVPDAVLSAIVDRAQQIVSSSRSLSEQLVQCVQDLLPSLNQIVEDDLYIMARPLAFEMRGPAANTAVEDSLAKVRSLDWNALSETEKARLGLVIASCALAELETQAKA